MEKKYFLFIPLFFLVFSFLFPFKGGSDRYLEQVKSPSEAGIPASKVSSAVPKLCTCYVSKEGFSAAGFLDGTILVDGTPLENRASGKYKTVYAIAASDDGRYLSVIAGVYPRTLFVYQKKQESWNLSHRVDLPDEVRRTPFLEFSGNMLLYEDAEGISVLSMTTFSRFSMAFSGVLKDVTFDPEQEYVWVVSGNDAGEDYIHMFLYNGIQVASAKFDGKENLKALRVVEQ